MRVRYEGPGNFDQRVLQGTRSLVAGHEYFVLEVYAQSDGSNFFRIEYSDMELPPLVDSRLFAIVSSVIPETWSIASTVDGSLTLGPREWNSPGFWEAFMDHEPWADDLYSATRSTIFDNS